MPSTYSSELRLEFQANGENSATWGTKTSTNLQLIEDAISGMASIATTGGDTTLTEVNGGTDQARFAMLKVTGVLVSNATIIVPAVTKQYLVWNATSGAHTVTVKTAAGGGGAITQGATALVFCDGTDVVLGAGGSAQIETLSNKTLASPAFSGTIANLGTVTTADINGGTIDGTTQASGTINGPIAAGGTWTAAATWTLPAHTLGGAITGNSQNISGLGTLGCGAITSSASTEIGGTGQTHFLRVTAAAASNAELRLRNDATNQLTLSARGDISACQMTAPTWDIFYDVPAAKAHVHRVNNATVTNTTSTGLAVTGTLSATGATTLQTLTVGLGAGSVASNTAVGYQALSSATTNGNCVAIGYQALQSAAHANADRQIAIGYQALKSNNNTAGAVNVAMGFVAGLNYTGASSTFIGGYSGYLRTGGNSCVFIGNGSGTNYSAVGTGQYNIGVGPSTLGALTSGFNNFAFGYAAGASITTGSNNVIIGNHGGTAAMANNIVFADGAGNIRMQHDGTDWSIASTTDATSTAASLKTAGGLLVEKKLYVGSDVNIVGGTLFTWASGNFGYGRAGANIFTNFYDNLTLKWQSGYRADTSGEYQIVDSAGSITPVRISTGTGNITTVGNIVMASGKALQTVAGYVEGSEMTAPAAPAANGFRIYAEDNGSGKTRLMVKFATGAAQQIAIEP